ncbi:MAG TPA: M1 family aminopeptidase [Terriglobales bacterium]|nr:M1 family aminopeptidase [Terriglobales bacterium]
MLFLVTAVICTVVTLGTPSRAQDNQTVHNALSPISPPGPLPEPFRIGSPVPSGGGTNPSSAALLYRQLRDVHLDPKQVHRIRDASIEREDVHITLDDGTIAFTQAVDGHVTGAFFEGDGEILLIPPDRVERRSLGLFTGSAILEEKFTSAFFRFNDDVPKQLADSLRETPDDPQAFVAKWDETINSLAEADALRLLTSFLNGAKDANGNLVIPEGDRMLRARLAGVHLGVFDLFFDTDAREQISVGQLAHDGSGNSYFNLWTAFPMRSKRISTAERRATSGRSGVPPAVLGSTSEQEPEDRLHISEYKIKVNVQPPTDLDATCVIDGEVVQGGQRVILLELSRFLRVKELSADGKPIDFLQNEALEGTALARRGNDLLAVIFPQPLRTGQKFELRMVYGGSVMSEAGGGLLYVGARGIWFPNRGVSMAAFDLEFTYPSGWSLVATGRQVSSTNREGEQKSRWVSERPIPLAGFNLGHYRRAVAKGPVPVEVYASESVESAMKVARADPIVTPFNPGEIPGELPMQHGPAPANNSLVLAGRVEKGLETLSEEAGPFPYKSLALSQMPGTYSQGWPGLIFLSSYAFLTPEEMARTNMGPINMLLYGSLMPLHEAAHNWWGDLIVWKSYRDQWLIEALANYCALIAMEKNGEERQVQQILDSYRTQLLSSRDKRTVADAGPVTLGVRLDSSYFPNGYDVISYGRGTWLFHMLRCMLRDAAEKDAKAGGKPKTGEDPFFKVLRQLREQNEGKYINNRIVQQAFEQELPESLRFEGKNSLNWFFDEWVNGTAIPKLEVHGVKFTTTGGHTVITGKIEQKDAPDELVTSVPLYGTVGSGKPVLLGRVFADGPESTFRLVAPLGTKKLEMDPEHTILRREHD